MLIRVTEKQTRRPAEPSLQLQNQSSSFLLHNFLELNHIDIRAHEGYAFDIPITPIPIIPSFGSAAPVFLSLCIPNRKLKKGNEDRKYLRMQKPVQFSTFAPLFITVTPMAFLYTFKNLLRKYFVTRPTPSRE